MGSCLPSLFKQLPARSMQVGTMSVQPNSDDLDMIFTTSGATDFGVRLEVVEGDFSTMAVAALECDVSAQNSD